MRWRAATAALVMLWTTGCPSGPEPKPPAPRPVTRTADDTGWSSVPALDDAALAAAVGEVLSSKGRLDASADQRLVPRVSKEQRGGTRYDTFVMLSIAYELIDATGRVRWTDTRTSVAALEVHDVPESKERARRVLAQAIERNVATVLRRLPSRVAVGARAS